MRRNTEVSMKRLTLMAALTSVVIILLAVLIWQIDTAQALPEYSAQTGEPCSSCHISPSGGGVRTPRGQAWVGSGKPGRVPELVEALDILGVHLDVDPDDYMPVPETVPPEQPLELETGEATEVHYWLKDYDGN